MQVEDDVEESNNHWEARLDEVPVTPGLPVDASKCSKHGAKHQLIP